MPCSAELSWVAGKTLSLQHGRSHMDEGTMLLARNPVQVCVLPLKLCLHCGCVMLCVPLQDCTQECGSDAGPLPAHQRPRSTGQPGATGRSHVRRICSQQHPPCAGLVVRVVRLSNSLSAGASHCVQGLCVYVCVRRAGNWLAQPCCSAAGGPDVIHGSALAQAQPGSRGGPAAALSRRTGGHHTQPHPGCRCRLSIYAHTCLGTLLVVGCNTGLL